MHVEKSIGLFLNYCRSRQLRERSIQSYEQALRLFAVWLREGEGIEDVDDIRERTVREYSVHLQERGKYAARANEHSARINRPENRSDYLNQMSVTTINNYLRNLRTYFNWLVEDEVLDRSPMHRIKLLKNQRKPREFMEDAEVKELLRVFDRAKFSEYRDMMIAMVILDTGMRLGETLMITEDRIDLYERTIRLPAENTKGRKDRTVFFSQRMTRELRRWLQYKDSMCQSKYAFPVKETGFMLKVGNFERNFRNYLARTSIEKHISPHTLRNNFAKRCLMSGMDIYTLSRILGHSSVKITEQAYLDVTDEDLKKRYVRHSPLDGIYAGSDFRS